MENIRNLNKREKMKLSILKKNFNLGMMISKKEMEDASFLYYLVEIYPEYAKASMNKPNVYNNFSYVVNQLEKNRISSIDIPNESLLWKSQEFLNFLLNKKLINIDLLFNKINLNENSKMISKLIKNKMISKDSVIWSNENLVLDLLSRDGLDGISVLDIPISSELWNNLDFVSKLLVKDTSKIIYLPTESSLWNNSKFVLELLKKNSNYCYRIPKNSIIWNDAELLKQCLEQNLLIAEVIPRSSSIWENNNICLELLQNKKISECAILNNPKILNNISFLMSALERNLISLNNIPIDSNLWNNKTFINALIRSDAKNLEYIPYTSTLWNDEQFVLSLLNSRLAWINSLPQSSKFYDNKFFVIEQLKAKKLIGIPNISLNYDTELVSLLFKEGLIDFRHILNNRIMMFHVLANVNITLDDLKKDPNLYKIIINDSSYLEILLKKNILNINDVPLEKLNDKKFISELIFNKMLDIKNLPFTSNLWNTRSFIEPFIMDNQLDLSNIPEASSLWIDAKFMITLIKNRKIHYYSVRDELWDDKTFVTELLQIEQYDSVDKCYTKLITGRNIPETSKLWNDVDFVNEALKKPGSGIWPDIIPDSSIVWNDKKFILENIKLIGVDNKNIYSLFNDGEFVKQVFQKMDIYYYTKDVERCQQYKDYLKSLIRHKVISGFRISDDSAFWQVDELVECVLNEDKSFIPAGSSFWNNDNLVDKYIKLGKINILRVPVNSKFWLNTQMVVEYLNNKQISISNVSTNASLWNDSKALSKLLEKRIIENINLIISTSNFWNDSSVLIDLINKNVINIKSIHNESNFWNNKETISYLLNTKKINFDQIPNTSELLNNKQFIIDRLKAKEINDNIFCQIKLLNDKNFIIELMQQNVLTASDIPIKSLLWKDKDFIISLIQKGNGDVKTIPHESPLWDNSIMLKEMLDNNVIKLDDIYLLPSLYSNINVMKAILKSNIVKDYNDFKSKFLWQKSVEIVEKLISVGALTANELCNSEISLGKNVIAWGKKELCNSLGHKLIKNGNIRGIHLPTYNYDLCCESDVDPMNEYKYDNKVLQRIENDFSKIFNVLVESDFDDIYFMSRIAKFNPDIYEFATSKVQSDSNFIYCCIQSEISKIQKIKENNNKDEEITIENLKLQKMIEQLKILIPKKADYAMNLEKIGVLPIDADYQYITNLKKQKELYIKLVKLLENNNYEIIIDDIQKEILKIDTIIKQEELKLEERYKRRESMDIEEIQKMLNSAKETIEMTPIDDNEYGGISHGSR